MEEQEGEHPVDTNLPRLYGFPVGSCGFKPVDDCVQAICEILIRYDDPDYLQRRADRQNKVVGRITPKEKRG